MTGFAVVRAGEIRTIGLTRFQLLVSFPDGENTDPDPTTRRPCAKRKATTMNIQAQTWVRMSGPRKLCTELPPDLRTTDSAIYAWLSGRTRPSYERAKAMADLAEARGHKYKDANGKKRALTVDDFRAPHENPFAEVKA